MKNILNSPRRLLLLGIDLCVFALCYYLAFFLRLERWDLGGTAATFWETLPYAVALQGLGMHLAGVNRGIWRYVSLNDLVQIVKGTAYGSGMLVAAVVFIHGVTGYPRSVILINAILVVFGVAGIRVSRRMQVELLQPRTASKKLRRVLVVGAGDAADDLIRELRQNAKLGVAVVGLLDDNPHKRGMELHGVKVLGRVDDLPELARRWHIEEVVIAIASATGAQMRRIIANCNRTGLPYRTLPGVGDIIDGRVHVSQLRKVNVEDLLRREPIRLDRVAISGYLAGKRVLVTGAAGSIGSEICRQVARFSPAEIIFLDHAENGLFYIEEEFERHRAWVKVRTVVADVTHAARMAQVMRDTAPQVVFHAAAHKHVYLMERNFLEAFRNNVTGSRVAAAAAIAAGVEMFVMISTDKAVNPTNVMGLSKRLAELALQGLQDDPACRTRIVAVRFGNVMGSQGSVIPLWYRQIRNGGPVTVTHPEVVRYFMTIPEAVQLVLQAASMGKGGEIFVLDMGEPVKVLDMAREVIRLSGKEPDIDIEIKFIGLRPGEKLYEELITAGEGILPTGHEKIMTLRSQDGRPGKELLARIARIEELVARCSPLEEVLAPAREIVPEYRNGLFSAATGPPTAADRHEQVSESPWHGQAAQKGPDARRAADGPFSAACQDE